MPPEAVRASATPVLRNRSLTKGLRSTEAPFELAARPGERAGSQGLRHGAPLEPGFRREAERFFGVSFADVRVHADRESAHAASALNAAAVTIGQNIFFGRGEHRPDTPDGRFLLVHELAHAAQQRAATMQSVGQRSLALAAGGHESEADAVASAFLAGTGRPDITTSPVVAACRGPLPRPAVRAPLRVPAGAGERYATPRTLSEWSEALRQRGQVRSAQAAHLIPTATLARGGSPPDFVTESQEEQMWAWGNAFITKRQLHILDKIEYETLKADTVADLQRILRTYIPEVAPREEPGFPTGPSIPVLRPFHLPPGVDDDGSRRRQVLLAALEERNRRLRTEARLRQDREAAAQVCEMPESTTGPDVDLDLAYGHCNERGCLVEPVAQQFGRYPCHADYARSISGVRREVRVETPDGRARDFDALGVDGTLYEVKTGYRFMLNTSPSTSAMRTGVQRAWIDQSQAQSMIAATCGFPLEWHFNDQAVADLADGLLAVHVHHTPYDCDVDSDE